MLDSPHLFALHPKTTIKDSLGNEHNLVDVIEALANKVEFQARLIDTLDDQVYVLSTKKSAPRKTAKVKMTYKAKRSKK